MIPFYENKEKQNELCSLVFVSTGFPVFFCSKSEIMNGSVAWAVAAKCEDIRLSVPLGSNYDQFRPGLRTWKQGDLFYLVKYEKLGGYDRINAWKYKDLGALERKSISYEEIVDFIVQAFEISSLSLLIAGTYREQNRLTEEGEK
jgi:hypothetical protein